jgi:propane monooxygenase large subunit
MPMAIDAVPNPEIHNGLAVQMIDEVRHSTIQMNLKRLYMNHYIDPAGFDMTEKAFANNYAGTIGRQFGEGFITGDAITAANIYLTVVAEPCPARPPRTATTCCRPSSTRCSPTSHGTSPTATPSC